MKKASNIIQIGMALIPFAWVIIFLTITLKVYIKIGYLPQFGEKKISLHQIVEYNLTHWERELLLFAFSIILLWCVLIFIMFLFTKTFRMVNRTGVSLIIIFLIVYFSLRFIFTGYMDWFYD